MIKLYGLALSNYYNVIKLAMLEKGVDFVEVRQTPTQDEAYTEISVMGRMPAVITPEGPLCETLAILDYLERAHPEPALFPSSPYQAGRAMQVHCLINNDLDRVVRPHITTAFFGAPRDEDGIQALNRKLERGCKALARVVEFSPYAVGEKLTHADLAVVNTAVLASRVAQKLGQPDPVMEVPGMTEYLERMEQRPHLQTVRADSIASLNSFLNR